MARRIIFLAILLDQFLLDGRVLVGYLERLFIPVFGGGHRSIHRDFQLLMPVVPQRVKRQIGGNPEEPGGELRAGYILLTRAVHANKNFLGQVFRLFPAPNHPVQEIDQRSPIALQEKAE
jgi:hypothetical protein